MCEVSSGENSPQGEVEGESRSPGKPDGGKSPTGDFPPGRPFVTTVSQGLNRDSLKTLRHSSFA